jgi:hypothetical protein
VMHLNANGAGGDLLVATQLRDHFLLNLCVILHSKPPYPFP